MFFVLAVLAGCSKGTQTATSTESAAPAASASAVAEVSASPSTGSIQPVNYDDLKGIFGEKEMTQLAALGVFGDANGHFSPAKPVTRREFVRWLFKANNSLWADDTNKLIHPAQGTESAFSDIKTSDPDFQYIQGMQDSGVSVGFPDKSFRPEQPITREQALAIKAALDRGGVDKDLVITKKDPTYGYFILPNWKDKHDIAPEFVGAIATGIYHDEGAQNEASSHLENVARTFGAIAMLKPRAVLTRGQAAIMLWKIGPHSEGLAEARTAAQALAPGGGVSPSP
ncbi:MAG: hypothetical protein DLM50_06150 [Candidatus Meridianibacter frigidus]|nr:MAG: hypothetical protein DLM50_06150 [Candidatus Eremiobacteraeota bacterium]